MDNKTENDWFRWIVGMSIPLPTSQSTRAKIADRLNRAVVLNKEVQGWSMREKGVASYDITVNAPMAFACAFQRWVDMNVPADESWVVVLAPAAMDAMIAKDPPAPSRSSAQPYGLHFPDGVHLSCRIETIDGTNVAAKDEIVMFTITGVPSAPVKLAMNVKAGENCTHVMVRAHELAERHLAAAAQGKTVYFDDVKNTFRFGDYRFVYVEQNRDIRGERRVFRCEMASEDRRRLIPGTKANLKTDDDNGPHIIHGVGVTAHPSRLGVEIVVVTFVRVEGEAAVPWSTGIAADRTRPTYTSRDEFLREYSGDFVVPSKESVDKDGRRGKTANRYAFREDVEQGNCFRFDARGEDRFAEMQRAVEEHLAKAMLPIAPPLAFTSPPCVGASAAAAFGAKVEQRMAERARTPIGAVTEWATRAEVARVMSDNAAFLKEWCAPVGHVTVTGQRADPALVAKLTADMSAAILGPTHELDRVVERESAHVPVKSDPARWGNVVRAIAAYYMENRSKKAIVRDTEWHTTVAKVVAEEVQHVRSVIERYEAFRREGYSRVHSYQRALGSPGNETIATMRARAAYESAK